ncbi:MAG: hypothetical protein Q9P01_03335 [Anaerolineae bacterium]|nr:hypothetical protein [Anaerolineae bacterium]MDQ7033887.1 hypothetical protein [Anaerolineae bacterium]
MQHHTVSYGVRDRRLLGGIKNETERPEISNMTLKLSQSRKSRLQVTNFSNLHATNEPRSEVSLSQWTIWAQTYRARLKLILIVIFT